MNDINFDELDKAVSSVLQDDNTDSTQSASPIITETESNEEAPAPADSSQEPTRVTPNRRRGQFMDMVHPSSRMSSSKPGATPTALPSRKASDLKPLNPAVVENSSEELPAEVAVDPPVQAEMTEKVVETVTEPTTVDSSSNDFESISHSQWPDPIDFVPQENMEHSVATTTTDETQDQATDEVQPQSEPPTELESSFEQETDSELQSGVESTVIDETLSNDEQIGSTSPFIEGTEVEKRPLGSFAGSPTQESNSPEENETTDDDSSSKPEKNLSTPVELESEIVSVESDSRELSNEQQPSAFDGGSAQAIPAQYQAKPSEPDVDEHAVFDTENYHQPLAPAEKKHGHTWLYILLFSLMMLLGAGIVYVLFLLGFF